MNIDWSDPDPYRHAPLTWDPRPDRPGYITHLGPATIYEHGQRETRGGHVQTFLLKCEAHNSTQVVEILDYAKAAIYEPGRFCRACINDPLPVTWELSNARTR